MKSMYLCLNIFTISKIYQILLSCFFFLQTKVSNINIRIFRVAIVISDSIFSAGIFPFSLTASVFKISDSWKEMWFQHHNVSWLTGSDSIQYNYRTGVRMEGTSSAYLSCNHFITNSELIHACMFLC